MSNSVSVFQSVEFGSVRTTVVDGEPMFVAMDIAKILDYSETAMMTRRLDDDEVFKIKPAELTGLIQVVGNNDVTIINESGLYNAIIGSKKPEAKRFKKWVTSEVLPSIRKNGGYIQENRAIDLVAKWMPNLDPASQQFVANIVFF